MKVHGKGILEGAASDLKSVCDRWVSYYMKGLSSKNPPVGTAWDISKRLYGEHLSACLICQTITEFCKREKVKQEKRWLTLKSQKAMATHGGYVWFWRRKPSPKGLAHVPEGPNVGIDETVAALNEKVDRTKPVFWVKVWSRASLNAKMKTNPDDPLVKRIEMLLLAREIEVPQDEWANVVAAGEAMLEAEAGQ